MGNKTKADCEDQYWQNAYKDELIPLKASIKIVKFECDTWKEMVNRQAITILKLRDRIESLEADRSFDGEQEHGW